MEYSSWEWHPLYGCYSRLVFKEVPKIGLVLIKREYTYPGNSIIF